MPSRRRISAADGSAALTAWVAGARERAQVALAVRYTLEELGERAPGRSTEVRVPPFGAVQCIAGLTHRRGTPPNVVEASAEAWLALATGALSWEEAYARGSLSVSGTRADLAAYLPLFALSGGVPPEPAADREADLKRPEHREAR